MSLRIKMTTALAAAALLSAPLRAINLQDWIKNGPARRSRRGTSKHTAVAAVRGVEEPGDVDPEARNYPSIQKMEQRKIPQDKLAKFIQEGKLNKK